MTNELKITITAGAQEEMARLLTGRDKKFIRLGVSAGGCSGFSYLMDFGEQKEKDVILEFKQGVKILANRRISSLVKGLEIDFSAGLQGKGFEYNNPNAGSTCGCGTSFSYKK